MTKKVFTTVIPSLILFIFTSCSAIGNTSSKTTPALQAAVLRVTADYLTAVSVGRMQFLNSILLWGEYSVNNQGLSKEQYVKQVKKIQTKQPTLDHPLMNLQPLSVEQDDDRVTITMKRIGKPGAEMLVVELLWDGGGWLVTDDNIFGNDGLISRL